MAKSSKNQWVHPTPDVNIRNVQHRIMNVKRGKTNAGFAYRLDPTCNFYSPQSHRDLEVKAINQVLDFSWCTDLRRDETNILNFRADYVLDVAEGRMDSFFEIGANSILLLRQVNKRCIGRMICHFQIFFR